jgi:hypothetical protein
MKNLFFAIALFVACAAGAQSTDTTKVKASITICDKDPQKVTVIISNPLNEKLTIDISSIEHGSLISKIIQANDFRTNFDFSGAADGDYTIEVSCRKGEKFRKTITMRTEQVTTRAAALK